MIEFYLQQFEDTSDVEEIYSLNLTCSGMVGGGEGVHLLPLSGFWPAYCNG